LALSVSQTIALKSILKPGMRVASMGYPDLIAPIEDMLGLKYRDDSEAICARHGLKLRRIPDAESYFSLMGCTLDVYDIVQERGSEILCDLNYAWGRNGQFDPQMDYDIVLDVGTVEHCFNIGQAMFNMAGLVKVGGYIIHENPFLMGNHGFYGINPTFFVDFYEQNGFKVIECKLTNKNGDSLEVPHTKRFRFGGDDEVNVFCLAQRMKVQSFIYPTQSKYKKLLADAGLAGENLKEMAHG